MLFSKQLYRPVVELREKNGTFLSWLILILSQVIQAIQMK